MSTQDKKNVNPEGELSESDLDKVVVTAKREQTGAAGTQVAQAGTGTKKN